MEWKQKIKFSVIGLHNFLHDLQDMGLQTIRFRTNRDDLFTEHQLTHAAPQNRPYEESSFTGQLKKTEADLSWFQFIFYRNDQSKTLKIGFDLDKEVATLEEVSGLGPIEIKKFLERDFSASNSSKMVVGRKMMKTINRILKYPALVTIAGGLIVVILSYYLGYG